MSDKVEPSERRVCVAMLNGAHGVRGDVRIRPFTDDPRTLERFDGLFWGDTGEKVTVRLLHPLKSGWAARITGIDNREDAERHKGTELFVSRIAMVEASPPDDPDSFFLIDLIGLTVISPSGDKLGTVAAVPDFGAGDLLELVLDEAVPVFGKSVLLPFEKRYVPDIELENGQLTVDLEAWIDAQSDQDKDNNGDEDEES